MMVVVVVVIMSRSTYFLPNWLTRFAPQSRFGNELLWSWLICPQNRTAVLKRLRSVPTGGKQAQNTRWSLRALQTAYANNRSQGDLPSMGSKLDPPLFKSLPTEEPKEKRTYTSIWNKQTPKKKNASFCVLFFWRSCFVNAGPNASALCSHDWLYPHPTLPIFEKKMSLRLPSQSLSSASSGLDEPASQEVFAKRRLNSSRREMVSLVLFSLFFSRVFFFFSKECSCFCLSWLSACFSTLPFRRCIYRCSQGPRLN